MVLSALILKNVMALGFVKVNILEPAVVAPKFVLASDAVLAPVPPSATARSVIPVIEPPVMDALLDAKLVMPDNVPPVMATLLDAKLVMPVSVPPVTAMEDVDGIKTE